MQLKTLNSGSKTVCGFFFALILKENYDVLKSKSQCILLKKVKTLIKTKWSRKWKITQYLERWILCFSSYKNNKLNVNLWWVGAWERKKEGLFLPFILSQGNFFNIVVLSQCIVYWIYFQNIHTFTYQKALLHTLLLLVFKIVKASRVSLKK